MAELFQPPEAKAERIGAYVKNATTSVLTYAARLAALGGWLDFVNALRGRRRKKINEI